MESDVPNGFYELNVKGHRGEEVFIELKTNNLTPERLVEVLNDLPSVLRKLRGKEDAA